MVFANSRVLGVSGIRQFDRTVSTKAGNFLVTLNLFLDIGEKTSPLLWIRDSPFRNIVPFFPVFKRVLNVADFLREATVK